MSSESNYCISILIICHSTSIGSVSSIIVQCSVFSIQCRGKSNDQQSSAWRVFDCRLWYRVQSTEQWLLTCRLLSLEVWGLSWLARCHNWILNIASLLFSTYWSTSTQQQRTITRLLFIQRQQSRMQESEQILNAKEFPKILWLFVRKYFQC